MDVRTHMKHFDAECVAASDWAACARERRGNDSTMKAQIQTQMLRLRIDEAELTRLLTGDELSVQARVGSQPLFLLTVQLADALALRLDDGWRLGLPAVQVESYSATLPRRDALRFEIADSDPPLTLDFEVDVRDSRKVRVPGRR